MTTIIRTMFAGICRDVHTLIWTILFPVGMLLGLGLYLNGSSYSERLLSGVLTTNVLFGSTMVTAFYVMAHRNRGIYKLLKITPFSTSAFILSVTAARAALTFLVSFAVIVLGIAVLGVRLTAPGLMLMFLILIIGIICFTAIGFLAANLSKDESNVNMISNLISFPMLFASEAFYSLQHAPGWVKMWSQLHPFHYFVEAMHASVRFSAGSPYSDVLVPAAILAVFTVLCMVLAKMTFRWDPADGPSRLGRKRV